MKDITTLIKEAAEDCLLDVIDGDKLVSVDEAFVRGANFALSLDRWTDVNTSNPLESGRYWVILHASNEEPIYLSSWYNAETNYWEQNDEDFCVEYWQPLPTPPNTKE